LRFLIDHDDLEGPVNLTAPHPVTNSDFTKAVAKAVHRPAILSVPPIALSIALGQFADEGALVSQRVVPRKLTETGFTFEHPDLDSALTAVLQA
jgi:NAD dependent epimerase/dehydratase family enzyme